jgi:hypothetical protein
MTVYSAFQPKRGANQKVTATITSQTITIGAGNKTIRALNTGTVVAYFVTYKASDETRVATVADTPIGPSGAASSVTFIEKPQDHDTLAYIADSATAVVNFQPGEGCS